ncbi:MAG: LEPR-XLL domain-containing protein, partial [Aquabacterium sp.]|nr:LEPR-XLL domain-containing protein [Aquabacterium sp.]
MAKRKGWISRLQQGLRQRRPAGKPEVAAAPVRERLVFESLEPRLLLSDTPIPLQAVAPAGTLAITANAHELKLSTDTTGDAVNIRAWDDSVGLSLGGLAPTAAVADTAASGADAPAQLFYLDLDGAQQVSYRGPVAIDAIEVGAFALPAGLPDPQGPFVDALLASLDARFSAAGIDFTADLPDGGDYSTIFVGGDGAAFAGYGSYLALSEQIDHGNLDRSDNAFVFSDRLLAGSHSVADALSTLSDTIAHEAGHLLGLEHEHEMAGATDPLAALAFKPYTHIEVAVDVRRDLLEDGKVTLQGVAYDVDPIIVEAVRQYPSYYYGGAVGPDGFPDLVMGQSVIHPDSTGLWLSHLLDKAWAAQGEGSPYSPAEQLQIMAFAYGFATHAAGDLWAHTLVNEFADGVFPSVGNVVLEDGARANAIRHLIVEGYIGDATPGYDGLAGDRTQLPDGDVSSNETIPRVLDAPHAFVFDALIRDLPDLPGHREQYLFSMAGSVTPTRTVVGLIGDLADGVPTLDTLNALRQRFATENAAAKLDPNRPAVPLLVNANAPVLGALPEIRVITPGQVWELKADYASYILRHRIAADGSSFIDVLQQQQSRGIVLDKFLELRQTLVELRAGLVAWDTAVPAIDQPFAAQVDQILAAGQRLLHGEEVDTDALFADLKSLGTTLVDAFKTLFGQIADGDLPAADALLNLAGVLGSAGGGNAAGYLDYWIANIDDGLQHWSELGLAVSRTLFDPQGGRDLQNREGTSAGPDAVAPDMLDKRAEVEEGVGLLDRLINQIEDPNADGHGDDSVFNRVLLPMLGMPDKIGELKAGLGDFIGEL